MPIPSLLVVALGGAIGAVLRALSHKGLTVLHGGLPVWSTLGVNVTGSLILGIVAGALADRTSLLAQLLMLGLLGAFTTFSTFAMDAVFLFRDRGIGPAALYVALSVCLSIAAFAGGYVATRGSLT